MRAGVLRFKRQMEHLGIFQKLRDDHDIKDGEFICIGACYRLTLRILPLKAIVVGPIEFPYENRENRYAAHAEDLFP